MESLTLRPRVFKVVKFEKQQMAGDIPFQLKKNTDNITVHELDKNSDPDRTLNFFG